jgi:multidrug resistance efflux pump
MIPTYGRHRSSPQARAAFSYRGLLIALVVLVAVPAIAWSLWPEFPWKSGASGPMMVKVECKDFIHEVTERGTVASASNVEVRCMVESRNMSGTQILYIVPEGTYVTPVPDWQPSDPDNPEEPPDLLVKLDSSALEAQLTQQQIVCANSEASMIQSQNVLDTAEIALEEYVKGSYVEEEQKLQAARAVANENLSRAIEYLDYSELLYSKGYISDRELQANAFDVEKKKLELAQTETALTVLEDYTQRKTVKQLEADIKTGAAKLEAAKHSYELDLEELQDVQTQIANCTIRAPQPGQVVYANITDRRGGNEVIIEEGASVRERQVLIKLPDPKRMQVEAKVNEAKVAMVTPGLPATIRLDAFASLELKGVVEKVSKYPAPSSFFTANVKEYDTIIRIDGRAEPAVGGKQNSAGKVAAQREANSDPKSGDTPAESDAGAAGGSGEKSEKSGQDDEDQTITNMRPGMTAEVKIRVEQIPQALQIPVQAVIEHGTRHFCVVPAGDGFAAREVTIGSTNDKVVVIEGGLEENEQVVLNAAGYRDQLNLPELPSRELVQNRAERFPDEGPAGRGGFDASGGSAAGGDRTGEMPAGGGPGGGPGGGRPDSGGFGAERGPGGGGPAAERGPGGGGPGGERGPGAGGNRAPGGGRPGGGGPAGEGPGGRP